MGSSSVLSPRFARCRDTRTMDALQVLLRHSHSTGMSSGAVGNDGFFVMTMMCDALLCAMH